MTVGIAVFMTIRQSNYTSVVAQYQSYWQGLTVDGHGFYPFNVNAILSNASGGQQSLRVDMALTQPLIETIEAGLANAYFVELAFYQFTPTATGVPPTAKTVFASFIGELLSAEQQESSVTIEIGSSLNGVEAQAPPRKFTTTLIGQPPKI
jgi:hypothetical protein